MQVKACRPNELTPEVEHVTQSPRFTLHLHLFTTSHLVHTCVKYLIWLNSITPPAIHLHAVHKFWLIRQPSDITSQELGEVTQVSRFSRQALAGRS